MTGFRRDLGGEIEKFARGAAGKAVPQAVQATASSGPHEIARTEDEFAPAINANAALERSPLVDDTLSLINYSTGAVYTPGVDFTEIPSSGQWTNLTIPLNTRLTASYYYRASPGAGVTDHGALSGLADDDHQQYHTDARGDARYVNEVDHTKGVHDALLIDAATLDGIDSAALQLRSEKGAANGYAPLDSGLLIPRQYLPGVAITSRSKVASEAEQLALVGQEEGDVAIRSDIRRTFIHNGGTAGTMLDWDELLSPTDQVTSVDGQTGAVILGDVYVNEADHTKVAHDALLIDAATLDGLDSQVFLDFANESRNLIMSGGGTISWSVVADKFKWTSRFIFMPVSENVSSSRYIDLQPPISGVTDTTGAERANADGITLNAWEALWFVHTRGSAFNTGNSWRVLPYDVVSGAFFDDENAHLIAVRNGDANNGSLYLRNGLILRPGRSIAEGYGTMPPMWTEVDGKPAAFPPSEHVHSGTVDQTLINPADTGLLTSLLSWIAGTIKGITGEPDWKNVPATTLKTLKTRADAHEGSRNGHPLATASLDGMMPAADKAKVASYPSMPDPADATKVLLGNGSFGNAPGASPLSVIVTVDTTLNANHGTVFVDAGTGARTITLPSAVDFDNRYIIKKIDASANNVIVAAPAGQTVEGLASISTDRQGDAVEIESDGANWRIVSAPTAIPPDVTNARITQAILETHGPGSLYDADLLDGKHASDFMLAAGPAVENWHEVGAAGEPAFANAWVNFDAGVTYTTAAFFKDPYGIVHLKGLIKNGTIGAAAFSLPVGYRPSATVLMATISNSAIGRVDVYTTGGVIMGLGPVGSNAWYALDGLSFRAA